MSHNLMSTPDSFSSNITCIPPIDITPSALDAPGHFLHDAIGFETFYKKAKKLCPLNPLAPAGASALAEQRRSNRSRRSTASVDLKNGSHQCLGKASTLWVCGHPRYHANPKWRFLYREIPITGNCDLRSTASSSGLCSAWGGSGFVW